MPRDLRRAGSSPQLLFWWLWLLLLAQPAASHKLAKAKGENEPIMLATVSMEVNAVRLLKLPALHGRLWVSSGG